jgi:hypothetical protein
VIGDAVLDSRSRAGCGHRTSGNPLPPQAFGAIMNIT